MAQGLYNLPDDTLSLTPEEISGIVSNALQRFTERTRVQKGYLQSGNFVSGKTGWKIDAEGNAEFQNVNIGVKNVTINSTQSIQGALDTIHTAGGGVLHLKAGTYVVTSALTLYSST